ncbi:MAG: hypothetical protein ACXAC5_05415 [Promethearchaeota archaeon]|jgi:uncharacterized protein with PQ loop repeat
MIEYFGITASILFIFATAGQTAKSIREGHSRGVSHILIWTLLVGFILMTTYVISEIGWDIALLSSYTLQFILWTITAKYKYWPRELK